MEGLQYLGGWKEARHPDTLTTTKSTEGEGWISIQQPGKSAEISANTDVLYVINPSLEIHSSLANRMNKVSVYKGRASRFAYLSF